MFWETKTNEDIKELRAEIADHKNQIRETIHKIDLILATKPDVLTAEEKARLADLEVKMAKLWGLLVETTPLGKDKLSKFGKRFGGKSKDF